jgi:hypothetical protein
MTKYDTIIEYFKDNHVSKVFFTKLSLSSGNPGIMYLHNTSDELLNFKDSFCHYLPIYVKNEDNIETMDFSEDINSKLELYSKRIWKESKVMAHRNTNVNGIYGELFLDIYLTVVSKIKLLISYASKRSFNSNFESKGIDSIGYLFNGATIELYLSEAKFVNDKYTAKTELLNDIVNGHSKVVDGKIITSMAHLTKEFLDDYFGFVLEKDISCPNTDRVKIKKIFDEFNEEINKVKDPKTFLDLIIEKGIRINFFCFAIFQASEDHPDALKTIFDDLIASIENQFNTIGISNYSTEVIFIPTLNTSMTIKREIDSFYD